MGVGGREESSAGLVYHGMEVDQDDVNEIGLKRG